MDHERPFHIIDTRTGKIVETYFSPRHRVTRSHSATKLRLSEEQFLDALREVSPNARLESGRNQAARLVLCEGQSTNLAATQVGTTESNVSALVRSITQVIKRNINAADAAKEFE